MYFHSTYYRAAAGADPNLIIQSAVESAASNSYAALNGPIPGTPIKNYRPNSYLIETYFGSDYSAVTPPTGWTERFDFNYASPAYAGGGQGQFYGSNYATSATAGTITTPGPEVFANAFSRSVAVNGFAISTSDPANTLYAYTAATEDSDTYSTADPNAIPPAMVTLAAIEDNDTFSGTAARESSATLAATESNDTYSGTLAGPTPLAFRGTGQGQYYYQGRNNLSVNGSVTPGLPSGIQVGDLMVVHWLMSGTNLSSLPTSITAGWTALDSNAYDNTGSGSGADLAQAVYYRFYQAGDTAPSISSFFPGGGTGQLVLCFLSAYSGVDTVTPFENVTQTATPITQDGNGTWGYTPAPMV
ncbi:MAG: hypothetical protein EOO77_35355, partial [Oxalobacteraceae bacterium]